MATLRAVLIPTLDEFSVHYASMGLMQMTLLVGMKLLKLETLLFPRMAVDQLVFDLAAQSRLGISWDQFLVVASHVKLAKRGVEFERWAVWNQSPNRGPSSSC